uniref:Unclassified LIM protein ML200239a n=1 Tax=Mnemiopsis leidyi TaxID=27923 RepID=H2DJY9_MNELE|nr:unclassified LIM protein ML200239a [Mnemiopsis leidyi]
MNAPCARCQKTVYPVEKLSVLDKVWHKGCFKCETCALTLTLKTYKGYNKSPYCNVYNYLSILTTTILTTTILTTTILTTAILTTTILTTTIATTTIFLLIVTTTILTTTSRLDIVTTSILTTTIRLDIVTTTILTTTICLDIVTTTVLTTTILTSTICLDIVTTTILTTTICLDIVTTTVLTTTIRLLIVTTTILTTITPPWIKDPYKLLNMCDSYLLQVLVRNPCKFLTTVTDFIGLSSYFTSPEKSGRSIQRKITVEYLAYRLLLRSPNMALNKIEDNSAFKYHLAFHDSWSKRRKVYIAVIQNSNPTGYYRVFQEQVLVRNPCKFLTTVTDFIGLSSYFTSPEKSGRSIQRIITVEYLAYRLLLRSPNMALDKIEDNSAFKYYLAFHDSWTKRRKVYNNINTAREEV